MTIPNVTADELIAESWGDAVADAINALQASKSRFLPTGYTAETFSRHGSALQSLAVLSTGRLSLTAIELAAGTVVTNITFISGSTAAVTPTAWWFALYSSSLALLRQTANQTTAAWAANSVKTLALTSTYTIPTTGLYYLGLMMAAATVPTIQGVSSASNVLLLPPALHGSSTTGLTTTAPNPAAALSAVSADPYALVS